jgi:hypothetical protein
MLSWRAFVGDFCRVLNRSLLILLVVFASGGWRLSLMHLQRQPASYAASLPLAVSWP